MNLLTAEQVAQILNINPETVRLYARQGKLSCYRFGPRCVRFAAEDVEEFKERFRVEAVDVFVPKACEMARKQQGRLGALARFPSLQAKR